MTGFCDPVPCAPEPEPPAPGTRPPPAPGAEPLLVEDTITRGSAVRAQEPARTTKTPVATAAAGRSQRFQPIPSDRGRNRWTTAYKGARGPALTRSRLRSTELLGPARLAGSAIFQPEGTGRRALIRERILSSPSARGSTESAAVCSARRSTTSRSRGQRSEWLMAHAPGRNGGRPWRARYAA
jgi:hypothetical protein